MIRLDITHLIKQKKSYYDVQFYGMPNMVGDVEITLLGFLTIFGKKIIPTRANN